MKYGSIVTLNGIRLNANEYLNWGTTEGDTGYGIRDNNGTIQYKNNGGSWTDISSGSSSYTPEIVGKIVTSQDVDYIEFTGLSVNTYNAYRLLAYINNWTVNTYAYYLFFNGDVNNSHYHTQYIYASGGSVVANRVNSSEFVSISSEAALCDILVERGLAHFYSKYFVSCTRHRASNLQILLMSGAWNYTSSDITSIRITSSASGGIGQQSKFVLIGYQR